MPLYQITCPKCKDVTPYPHAHMADIVNDLCIGCWRKFTTSESGTTPEYELYIALDLAGNYELAFKVVEDWINGQV